MLILKFLVELENDLGEVETLFVLIAYFYCKISS